MGAHANRTKYLILNCVFLAAFTSIGTALAGNFASLAVGVCGEEIDSKNGAGAVNIIHGSTQGLTGTDNVLWSQNTDGISGGAETDDHFGSAVASGDFNNDGFSDLAIGVPDESIGATAQAGALYIIYGSSPGLTASNSQLWWQGRGLIGSAEPYDNFGKSLAAGDFNGDGFSDLVTGAPREDIYGFTDAGAIHIIYGSPLGLTGENDVLLHEGMVGTPPDQLQNLVRFGSTLAAGDFNKDGFMDLALGVPGATIAGKVKAGEVYILTGTATGLDAAHPLKLNQGVPELPGIPGPFDLFGAALTTGDFNGDSFSDLAIGTPRDSIGGKKSGTVTVIYGSALGLSGDSIKAWHQGADQIVGMAENWDGFGGSLATGDFNNDGFADLAIGVPDEDIGATANAGSVNIIYGSDSGLTSNNNQGWNQGAHSIHGDAEVNDHFGKTLAAGDLNNDGFADLAIGVPGEDIGATADAGAIHIILGSASGLAGAGNQIWGQGHNGILGAAAVNSRFGCALAFLPGKIFPWPMFLPAIIDK